MKRYLFLDDMRNPQDVTWAVMPTCNKYDVVRSYDEFVAYIISFGIPEYVTFDHDLADEHYFAMTKENNGEAAEYGHEKTGYDCAVWLTDFCFDRQLKFPLYGVHSMNPIGKDRIINYVENAKKHLEI